MVLEYNNTIIQHYTNTNLQYRKYPFPIEFVCRLQYSIPNLKM